MINSKKKGQTLLCCLMRGYGPSSTLANFAYHLFSLNSVFLLSKPTTCYSMSNIEVKLQKFMGRPNENYAIWRFRLMTMLKGKTYRVDIDRKFCSSQIKMKATNIVVSPLDDVLESVCMNEGDNPFSMIELLDAHFAYTRTSFFCGLFYFVWNTGQLQGLYGAINRWVSAAFYSSWAYRMNRRIWSGQSATISIQHGT